MGRSPDRPYPRPRVRPWTVGRWEMWQLRGPVVAVVLLVCGTAALLVGVEIGSLRPTAREILMTGALVVLGLVHTEIASKVERMRRRVSDTSYYDLSSVWTFAAALLLPPPLAATVVVAVYLHLWVRVWRPAKSQLYRNIYTAAAVVLAAQAAHAVVSTSGGVPRWSAGAVGLAVLALAVVAYALVNNILVITVIALQDMPAAEPGPAAPPARQGRRHRTGDGHAVAGRADRRVRDAQPVARPARAGPVGGAAPGRHGAPARAAGRDGRQDRPPQRRGLARQGRAGAAPRAAPGSRGRCPHPRPGPLQVRQRHLRAPRGRRGPGRGRRDAARRGAGGRRRRPVRRRGVRGAAARPRPDLGGPPPDGDDRRADPGAHRRARRRRAHPGRPAHDRRGVHLGRCRLRPGPHLHAAAGARRGRRRAVLRQARRAEPRAVRAARGSRPAFPGRSPA